MMAIVESIPEQSLLFIGHRHFGELRAVAVYDQCSARAVQVIKTESEAVLFAERYGLEVHYADTYDA